MRSSARSRWAWSTSAYGVMWAGLTMARSRPASTQWWRKTELRTARAWGWSPKLTLLTPRDVNTPGSPALMRRMPSMVSRALRRNSASPVARVKVRSSKIRSSGRRPYSSTTMSWMRRATASFRSAVLAIPSSSMVRATRAAPCSTASGTTSSIRARPFSRLMELMVARPGYWRRAASATSRSVVSMTSGVSTLWARSSTRARIWAASSWRSVRATQTSRRWAPPSTWLRATSRTPS